MEAGVNPALRRDFCKARQLFFILFSSIQPTTLIIPQTCQMLLQNIIQTVSQFKGHTTYGSDGKTKHAML